ncbi:SLC13 family permease [Alkalibacillus silvisoli]
MTSEMVFVSGLIFFMIIVLLSDRFQAEWVIFSTLVVLLLSGVLEPLEAARGFVNEGVWTIGLLFVIAGVIERSGVMKRVVGRLLRGVDEGSVRDLVIRLLAPAAGASSFLNNTPIVVTLVPVVRKWCKRNGVSETKLLIPLSYVTILGGTVTLIGTSTNLVVDGLLREAELQGFGFLQLAIVGVPITIVGLVYVALVGWQLLPEKRVGRKRCKRRGHRGKVGTSRGKELDGWIALGLLGVAVVLVAFGLVPMLVAIASVVVLLLVAHVLKVGEVIRTIPWQILILVSSAIGVGLALSKSGLADLVAVHVLAVAAPLGTFAVIVALYLLTNLFTELMTNVAAAVLMLPIGLEMAQVIGVDPIGFAVVIAIAASASFVTPIGYQTNLVVYQACGYRFTDFVQVGLPLSVVVMLVTSGVVYWVVV